MKRHAFLFLVVGCFLLGCGEDSSTEPSAQKATTEEKKPRIALVMKTLTNPFFISMENGARRAEKELGIELIVKTATQETSISQQIEIVDKLVRDNAVDAIVIAPGDSVQLIPVLKKAQDTGTVIVNIDNRLDQQFSDKVGLKDVPFISVDNVKGAYLSAKHIADQASGHSKAAILEGIRSAGNAQDRKAGAEKAFKENPNIELVASETANWKIDEGQTVTAQIFTDHPDIKLLFCANDMMALGAIEYLTKNNRQDVLVAGYDALDEAKKAVESGLMEVTIDQQPQLQGYIGVETALKMLNRQKVDLNVLVDVFVIKKDTLK